MRKLVLLLLFLFISFLVSIFAYNNSSQLSVNLGFKVYDSLSLSFIIICSFVVGWLVGILSALVITARGDIEKRSLKCSLHLAEEELYNLRNLPLKDAD